MSFTDLLSQYKDLVSPSEKTRHEFLLSHPDVLREVVEMHPTYASTEMVAGGAYGWRQKYSASGLVIDALLTGRFEAFEILAQANPTALRVHDIRKGWTVLHELLALGDKAEEVALVLKYCPSIVNIYSPAGGTQPAGYLAMYRRRPKCLKAILSCPAFLMGETKTEDILRFSIDDCKCWGMELILDIWPELVTETYNDLYRCNEPIINSRCSVEAYTPLKKALDSWPEGGNGCRHDGWSPLHTSVFRVNHAIDDEKRDWAIKCIHLLVMRGADRSAKWHGSKEQPTPYDLCASKTLKQLIREV